MAKGQQRFDAGGHRDSCISAVNVCGSTLHIGRAGSAAGSSNWAYALRSGLCPGRRRAIGTASARLEVAMLSAFQEKFSYTMIIRGLLDGGPVMVSRMRAFTVARQLLSPIC